MHLCMHTWIDGWIDGWPFLAATYRARILGDINETWVETDRNLADSFTILPNLVHHLGWPPMAPHPQSFLDTIIKSHSAHEGVAATSCTPTQTTFTSTHTTVLCLPPTNHLCANFSGRACSLLSVLEGKRAGGRKKRKFFFYPWTKEGTEFRGWWRDSCSDNSSHDFKKAL